MKSLKKILCYILIASLSVPSVITFGETADAATTANLATFSFSKPDGSTTDKSLNDTYKTNADTGYSATGGIIPSSKLFASVADPSKSDYRKLEWSGTNSPYIYNNSAVTMPIMSASDKNPWGSTPFFLIKTSTKGYENITLSLLMGGSKKGPKNFKLQYSTDGKTYTDISGATITISENKKMFPYNFTLSTLKDKSTLYIRIIASSTSTIEGGSFVQADKNGETAINNIVLKGSAITQNTSRTPTPSPTKKPNGNSASSTTAPNKNNNSNKNNSSNNNNNNSNNNNNNNNSNNNNDGQNTNNTSSDNKKTLSKPSLTSYKPGSKVIRGKAAKKSSITLTTGKKTYTAKVSKKGKFKIKLGKKLKKGQVIKLYAAKNGYNNSKTRKYTVK